MKKVVFLFLVFSICFTFHNSYAQPKKAFQIYNSKGRKVSYSKLINKAKSADVVLFGEYHDNPISHWLELEVTKDLLIKSELILGAEMLETDDQQLLDEFVNKKISLLTFDSNANLWSNFKTDYLPVIKLARDNDVPIFATNIPREYAKMVFKKGGFSALDSLSDEEKNNIAPLPIRFDANLPQYKKMFEMMGGHGGIDIVKAQAIKDATIAYFIQKNRTKNSVFLHINGAYHSDFKEGIYWYLKQLDSTVKCITISTVKEENISKFNKSNRSRADFIISVDLDMTSTY